MAPSAHPQEESLRGASDGAALGAVAVIPARLGSTRLPRKMLLDESGAPLIVETVRNTTAAGVFDSVVVATDSAEIVDAVQAAGFEAVLTDPGHPSGTDRVLEAATTLGLAGRCDLIVNVQGDEPELRPQDLRALVTAARERNAALTTMWVPFGSGEDPGDPAAVKVVATRDDRALYFSRAAVPAAGHGSTAIPLRRHLGVYAFQPEALERFCALETGALERAESLEQLRWLEAGHPIHLVRASAATQGIDTLDDYRAFVARRGQARD